MKGRIADQFLANYVLMFLLSVIITLSAFALTDFANHVLADTLRKNTYTAAGLLQADYHQIDAQAVVENGGGVQVINREYEIVRSQGLNPFHKDQLTPSEFTDFLTSSKGLGVPYSHDIAFHPEGGFWLIVTFPTSLRIDFAIAHNKDYASKDMQRVSGAFLAVLMFYLLLLAVTTVIYSKLSSIRFINPMRALSEGARRLRDGDYSARVAHTLKNEFGELQDTFNAMAEKIEHEMALRKQSEENRKRLILDISHDLKNPLSSIMGYAELIKNNQHIPAEDLVGYTEIIYNQSVRANHLITDLFELSKMDSPDFALNRVSVDICEFLRQQIGTALPLLEKAGFPYHFDIPEREIILSLDIGQMSRVFQNLFDNAVQYNPTGTAIHIRLEEHPHHVSILFEDHGIGIPEELSQDIFLPFIRVDRSRNSQSGGTGLGLAIVDRIISSHDGSIRLATGHHQGTLFTIDLPKI